MKLEDLPEEIRSSYKELKAVDGKVVGFKCVECGRLSTAPHFPTCSIGGDNASGESGLDVSAIAILKTMSTQQIKALIRVLGRLRR